MIGVRLGGALGILAAVALLLARLAPLGPSALAAPVEVQVVALAWLAAWACLLWLAYVLLAVAVGAFPRGAVRDLAERVLGITAVGVTAGALVAVSPAAADGPFDRPVARHPASTASPLPRGPVHVVAPGDTLWGIAARRLGVAASPALTAATWPRWYAANRPRIGPDPGRILPGQRLVPPNDGGPR